MATEGELKKVQESKKKAQAVVEMKVRLKPPTSDGWLHENTAKWPWSKTKQS